MPGEAFRDGPHGDDRFAGNADRLAELAGVASALAGNLIHHVQALLEDLVDDSGEVAREAEALVDAASNRFSDARDLLRVAPRLSRVVTTCLGIVARYRLHGALQGAQTDLSGEPPASLERLHRRSARRLRLLCEELRGGVLKLGQFASSRMDLLPEAYVTELSKLQDRVPPVPSEALAARMERELGPDWGEHFASFEIEPLAAASLAQVHGATLADGTPVAVKLLLPDIEEEVDADLAALRLLAPVLRDALPRVDLETLIGGLGHALRRELDLGAEAAAARQLRDAFADDPDLIVPRVHAQASSRGVLVLERIEGERLIDFLDGCESRGEQGALDRDRLCEILIRSFCAQVLVHGIFQGDPHPGNFLVLRGPRGPRLAMLDFGCVQRYEAPLRRQYAALAVAILARDEARMAEGFAALGFRSRDGDPAGLRAYAEMFLEAFRQGVEFADAGDHVEHVARILALTEANPIVEIPEHFVLLGRVFASLGGLLKRYPPRIRLSALLQPELAAALHIE
jgi:ubiquinone biosynthesis protein